MTVEEISAFLSERPGYIKKGSKALHRHLKRLGYKVKLSDCLIAQQVARKTYHEDKLRKAMQEGGKVLIYDIETSYYLGKFYRTGKQWVGAHQIVKDKKIICISYKWLGEKEVYNLSWDSSQSERFLLEQFIDIMNEADLIVAHNGDKFDLKEIAARALKYDLKMLPKYNQFDTYKVAKRKFNLPAYSLNHIAKYLNLPVSKYKVPEETWDACILGNSREALKELIEYCDQDVKVLEQIYAKLVGWIQPMYYASEDKTASPISGGKNLRHVKTRTNTQGWVRHIMEDLDTNRLFEMSDTNYKKYMANV